MAKFCDPGAQGKGTPCIALIQSLGVHIYYQGPPHCREQLWYSQVISRQGEISLVQISYCPFCGTRMMFTDESDLEKWRLPRVKIKERRQLHLIWYKNGVNRRVPLSLEEEEGLIAYS